MSGGHWRGALFAVSILFAASAPGAVRIGQPLAAALEELRGDGLRIIFSSALIGPGLIVSVDPDGGSPETVARRILAPHGLVLHEVRPGLFAVEREDGRDAADAEAPDTARADSAAIEEPLPVVSVYASRYAIDTKHSRPAVQFTREELDYLPGLNEDVLRITRYLPGTASNALSARAHVRGGREEELAVFFDGVPLFEPFHFKDVQSLLGILEPQSVSTVYFYSGVFPVRYGNRISGVLEIQPRQWSGAPYHEIGVSLLYSHALTQGRLESLPVEWLASVRRGNVDLLASALEQDDVRPVFFDAFGRVEFDLRDRSKLAAGWLLLDDGLKADLDDEQAEINYRDATAWFSWRLEPDEGGRELRATLSHTERHTWRDGSVAHGGSASGFVDDRRFFDTTTARLEGSVRWSDRLRLSGGLEAYVYEAHYGYASEVTFDPALAAALGRPPSIARAEDFSIDGQAYAAQASALVDLTDRTLLDIGLRWDGQRFGADFEGNQLSPRLSVQFERNPATVWRLSWGRFSQTDRPDELSVQDGDREFHPTQHAEQLVASLERRPSRSLLLRAEAFRKRITTPGPTYENLLDPFVMLPELAVDRVRIEPDFSHAYGVELSARWELPPQWLVWGSYSRSSVQDDFGDDGIPRTWDQKHSLVAGVNWSHGPWGVSANTTWHTGWRRNELRLLPDSTVVLEGRNSESWPDYFSLDLRGTWRRSLPVGALQLFVEVDNVANHGNPCCADYRAVRSADALSLTRDVSGSMPRLFLIGVTWQLP